MVVSNTMNIYYMTPQGPNSWGAEINRHCSIVPNPHDWICLVEADVMMFPANWHEEVLDMVQKHPDIDVWTAYATRTKRKSEAYYYGDAGCERDMVNLYTHAAHCFEVNRGKYSIRKHSPSGFFYVFRKSLWQEIPFPEQGGHGEKNLHMDILWAKRLRAAGKVVGLMQALCCVHYYRMHAPGDYSHLI